MATIKTRENDLFRAGAVDVNLELYETIVGEAKSALGRKFLQSIDWTSIREAIARVRNNEKKFSGTDVIGKTVKLSLFLQDVQFTDGGVTAEIRLSLPIMATEEEHAKVWKELLGKIGCFGFDISIKSGEASFLVFLNREKCSVKKNGITNGKPSFVGDIAA